MTFLAPLLANWQKIVAIIAGCAVLCLLSYCQGRADGRAGLQAEIDAATVQAANRADADEQARRDAAENRADAIEGVIRNAVANDPEGGNRAAGPVTRDTLDELRRRSR